MLAMTPPNLTHIMTITVQLRSLDQGSIQHALVTCENVSCQTVIKLIDSLALPRVFNLAVKSS